MRIEKAPRSMMLTFRDGVEVSEFIVENGEFSFAPKFPSKSTAVMVN